MILLWTFSLIVTNVVAIVTTIHVKNEKHRIKLNLETSTVEHATWSLAFDAGWNAAITDPGTILSNYRKMFVKPYDN